MVLTLAVAAGAACGNKSPAQPTDCSQISVSPAGQTLASGGGAGSLVVTAPAGCAWYAASSASWITITAGAAGSGEGAVGFTAAANPLPAARTGSLQVSGHSVAVTQEGTPPLPGCIFELSPSSRAVPAGGASFLAIVLTPYGCRWSFGSNDSWIQVIAETEGAPNGNGNGSVEVHVAQNTGVAARTGTATIAGQVLVVVQDGTSTPACAYSVSPPSAPFGAVGGSGQLTVQTSTNCSWSVEPDYSAEDFVRLGGVSRGAGTRAVPYAVSPNLTFSGRHGALIIHGDSGNARLQHQVDQAAATCLYTVSPTEASYAWLSSGSGFDHYYVDVSTQPGTCSWTATSTVPWITVWSSYASGTGARRVFYSVGNNNGSATRTGDVVVSGLSGVNPPAKLTVTQTGK